jgi:hypothetical protein
MDPTKTTFWRENGEKMSFLSEKNSERGAKKFVIWTASKKPLFFFS